MTAPIEKQLRHDFVVTSGATPKSGKTEFWDGDILWVTPEDLTAQESYWVHDTQRKITQAGYESCGATIAPRGSIVLTKRAPIGQVALLARPACSNQGCFLLTPRKDQDSRYYFYWLSVQTDRLQALGCGSTFMELSTYELKSLRILTLPLSRQRAIADYLDRETARIDALVATKERVLTLLADKRRALITRAVTRGLDPNVPFRDSGIQWVGEIPEHWEVWKLGHSSSVGNGSTPNRSNATYWTDGTIPWLNSSVVNRHEATEADQFVTETALGECHLPLVRSGSVLVAITGQGKTRGRAVVLSFDATINQHLAYVSPDLSRLDPWFLRWTFLSAYPFLRSISDDAGGTKGALTCEDVANIRLPVPPIDEQRAIVAHVANETSKLDNLRAVTERTTALLNERRATLIGAAVTGQVGVESAA
ncbi:MAG: restriction endonuclease subunit S [Gemmatimonadetes bacterium]|nr:restriction endonuclease subunit S [Gemmatimonadota bacterium]